MTFLPFVEVCSSVCARLQCGTPLAVSVVVYLCSCEHASDSILLTLQTWNRCQSCSSEEHLPPHLLQLIPLGSFRSSTSLSSGCVYRLLRPHVNQSARVCPLCRCNAVLVKPRRDPSATCARFELLSWVIISRLSCCYGMFPRKTHIGARHHHSRELTTMGHYR